MSLEAKINEVLDAFYNLEFGNTELHYACVWNI